MSIAATGLDPYLIEKYNVIGPYYTSYPAVGHWSKDFSHRDFIASLANSFEKNKKFPLSLYTHFPFCAKLCYFCICHMQVTNNRDKIDKFLTYFLKEIGMFRQFLDDYSLTPDVKEVHLGGGSPTHMDAEQFDRLVAHLETIVKFKDLNECALEIDIRTIKGEDLAYYHSKGINRISFGVQDFNPEVQEIINRVQPLELFRDILTPDVRERFQGVNFDLIYGMPRQTVESFHETIEIVRSLNPDRLSVYNYCHNPKNYKHQRIFREEELPSEEERTRMYVETVQNLLGSGYERIGIDHFAKSTDTLAIAKRDKTLHRSFMGYTVGRTDNLVGVGPSALSDFSRCYAQNVYENSDYYKALDQNVFPVFRGHIMQPDDIIRRELMNKLLCHFSLNFKEIEKKFEIDMKKYFACELEGLGGLIDDGLMELNNEGIKITPLGEFFVRNICRVFDRYLQNSAIL